MAGSISLSSTLGGTVVITAADSANTNYLTIPAANGIAVHSVANTGYGYAANTGATIIASGNTAQRPSSAANGSIRYNTTIPALEAYVGGAWVTVASPFAAAITKQTLGPGDGVSTIFGPLNATFAPSYAASADNILVLVENVMQISTTNFGIFQNPSATGSGAEINATALSSANNGTDYVITAVGSTTFTSFGAAANTQGTVFTKSGGTPTGTGKVRVAGYYLGFTSAIPNTGGGGNPVYVTVYYGYAN